VRTVFLGTPDFAVPTLERLLSSPHDVVGVVTQPDRRRGRGQRVSASPVKHTALAHGLPILQPERLRDPAVQETLEAWRPDVGVVAAYGRLIPDHLLSLPRHGMINVHASLLPKYRGAAPIHRAVMAGDTETGITIIKLVREMDAGPMVQRATMPIHDDDTSVTVEHALARLGAELLLAAVDEIEAGTAVFVEQDHASATLAPRITRDDGVVDWHAPAPVIHNHVRGLHPWPHAFSFLEGRRLLLLRSSVVVRPALPTDRRPPVDGEVITASRGDLIVATGDGTALALHEVQPEGRRPLDTRAFLAGHPIEPGVAFTATPDAAK